MSRSDYRKPVDRNGRSPWNYYGGAGHVATPGKAKGTPAKRKSSRRGK